MSDCGCRYEPWLGIDYATHESVGGNIIYCPMHKAAPVGYELVKELYQAMIDYEWNAEGDAPIKHRKMMQRAKDYFALADGSDRKDGE